MTKNLKKPAQQQSLTNEQEQLIKKEQQQEMEKFKQAEERRKLEDLLKQEEEYRKYDAVQIQTGLLLYLTEWAVQQAWNSSTPKEFFTEFINKFLSKHDLTDNFEASEISIIAEYHLYNLIFAKEELSLDDYKSTILLNILWELIKNNNVSYQYNVRKYKEKELLEQKYPYLKSSKQTLQKDKQEKIQQNQVQKSLEQDFIYFKDLLLNHSYQKPPRQLLIFDFNQVQKIIDYVQKGYFQHYSLFQYVFNNPQKKEEIKVNVQIDQPLEVLPLKDALYMGKEKFEILDEENELKKQLEQKRREEAEKQLKELEDEKMKLESIMLEDPKETFTKIILKNVSSNNENMIKSIVSQCQQDLETQINQTLNLKKK